MYSNRFIASRTFIDEPERAIQASLTCGRAATFDKPLKVKTKQLLIVLTLEEQAVFSMA